MGLKVFAVDCDFGGFQSLLLDVSEAEFETTPVFQGDQLADGWTPLPVVIDDERYWNTSGDESAPDFWHLNANGRVLAVPPRVIERLEQWLSIAGELLPLDNRSSEDTELFALNVTATVDHKTHIDMNRSHVDGTLRRAEIAESHGAELFTNPADRELFLSGNDPYPVLYADFIIERVSELDPTLFKLRRIVSQLLLIEDSGRTDTLLRRIETFAMTGLVLTPIWSTEVPDGANLFAL